MKMVKPENFTELNEKDTNRWKPGSPAREEELARLLEVARCPLSCTEGAYYNAYGETEQCQFCYEREQVLK